MLFILVTGFGDVTYNSRRNILGAIGLNGKISYHLFGIQHNGYEDSCTVKLLRKAKWHSQYSSTFSANFTSSSSPNDFATRYSYCGS